MNYCPTCWPADFEQGQYNPFLDPDRYVALEELLSTEQGGAA